MTFTAALDASGSADTASLCVAGYIARDDQWAALEPLWNTILADADVKPNSEGKRIFHMKRLVSSTDQFAGWTPARQANLLAQLITEINAHALRGLAFGFSLMDYGNATAILRNADPKFTKKSPEAYTVCLVRALELVRYWLRLTSRAEEAMSYLVEAGDVSRGIVEAAAEGYIQAPDWKRRFAFGGKADVRLQAADLFAWEVRIQGERKLLPKNGLLSLDPHQTRISLRRLLREPIAQPLVYWYDQEGLVETALNLWNQEESKRRSEVM